MCHVVFFRNIENFELFTSIFEVVTLQNSIKSAQNTLSKNESFTNGLL